MRRRTARDVADVHLSPTHSDPASCFSRSAASSSSPSALTSPPDDSTDLYMNILDTVPPIHVVSNHVATDKLTTANGGTFTSRSASFSSQSY